MCYDIFIFANTSKCLLWKAKTVSCLFSSMLCLYLNFTFLVYFQLITLYNQNFSPHYPLYLSLGTYSIHCTYYHCDKFKRILIVTVFIISGKEINIHVKLTDDWILRTYYVIQSDFIFICKGKENLQVHKNMDKNIK